MYLGNIWVDAKHSFPTDQELLWVILCYLQFPQYLMSICSNCFSFILKLRHELHAQI